MLHLNIEKKRFNKIFLELRFKEIFSLPDYKYKILDKLSKGFTNFDTNQPDRISMFNQEKRLNVHININRILIDWDQPPSIQEFTKVSLNLIRSLNSIVTLEDIKRIGVRSFLVFPTESDKEVESYIINKYFSTNARNTTNFADQIFNPSINFSGRKGPLLFNFGVVLTQEQIIQGEVTRPLYAEMNHYLTYDVDVYRELGVKVNNLEKFLSSTVKLVDESLLHYIKSVEG
jgi:hypothetical protein